MALPNPQRTLTCREVALRRLEEVRAVAETGIEEQSDTVFELNHIDQHTWSMSRSTRPKSCWSDPTTAGAKAASTRWTRSRAKRTAVMAASMSPRTAPTKAAHATTERSSAPGSILAPRDAELGARHALREAGCSARRCMHSLTGRPSSIHESSKRTNRRRRHAHDTCEEPEPQTLAFDVTFF